MKVEGESTIQVQGILGGVRIKYDQDTLCTCVKTKDQNHSLKVIIFCLAIVVSNVDCQMVIYNHHRNKYLWGCFQKGLTEEPRVTLNVGAIKSILGSHTEWDRRKKLATDNLLFLLPDSECTMMFCFPLSSPFLPVHNWLHPSTVSQKALPSWGCFCQ